MTKRARKAEMIGNLYNVSEEEFGIQTEPYRNELIVHCYRMVGSLQDAEDLVQETFVRAWNGRRGFEGRASLRTWLYKIATNLCLNWLEKRTRRSLPIVRQSAASLDEPIPADINEPIWLEPFPDSLLASTTLDPATRFDQLENIRLAFLIALQQLPPRQRAILILRDVLEWSANEVADLLNISVTAVKSALFRARTTLSKRETSFETHSADNPTDPTLADRLSQYVYAWETANVEALVQLLKADATFSMPPIPSWYQGRGTITGLVSKTIFRGAAQGRWRLLPTRANGETAFGLYRVGEEANVHHAYGIQVVRFQGIEIADITTFRVPALFASFGLPMKLVRSE
ncbi:MAG: sigma-70 family RNA polymerase sigma factor [Caldilineaceae bacterium]